MVAKVVFGRGSFNQLGEIIAPMRKNERAPFIFLVMMCLRLIYYLSQKSHYSMEIK